MKSPLSFNRNGEQPLRLILNRKAVVYGGPFRNIRPDEAFGVCLAPESPTARLADTMVHWPDFGVPQEADVLRAIDLTLDAMMRREVVYVGCMGGIGRTGTFIACLLKLFGDKNPVNTLRANYLSHAVETPGQMKFIDNIQFPRALKFKLFRLRALALISGNGKSSFNDRKPNRSITKR